MRSGVRRSRSQTALLSGQRPWLRILGLLAGIQVLLVAGHIAAFAAAEGSSAPREARQLLDFNQEGSVPTYWSAVVLASAGALALTIRRGPAWLLAGAGLVWIGLEEAFVQLHEDVQIGTGIDWPVFYAPPLVAGAWVLLVTAHDLGTTGRRLLMAGLACMVAGVGAELLSSPAIALDFQTRNLVEENLELAGAGFVLCAFASALRTATQRENREPSPAHSPSGLRQTAGSGPRRPTSGARHTRMTSQPRDVTNLGPGPLRKEPHV